MALLYWKFFKFLGISLFAAGLFSAFVSQTAKRRAFAGHWLSSLGLLSVWLTGYGMMKLLKHPMSTIWIVVPLLASLVAWASAVAASGFPKARPWLGGLAASGFVLSMIGMVFRTQPHDALALILVPLVFVSCAFTLKRNLSAQEEDPDLIKDLSLHWFIWLARFEGLSLLTLLGVYMPLKYGAGIVLDGGQGWFGWLHGIFQLFYLAGMLSTAKLHAWSLPRLILAGFVSAVPFGTFWFERRLKH